jgi:hypothetical protein
MRRRRSPRSSPSEPPGKLAEKLTLTLDVPKSDIRQSQLKISWGKLQLKAPLQVSVRPD